MGMIRRLKDLGKDPQDLDPEQALNKFAAALEDLQAFIVDHPGNITAICYPTTDNQTLIILGNVVACPDCGAFSIGFYCQPCHSEKIKGYRKDK